MTESLQDSPQDTTKKGNKPSILLHVSLMILLSVIIVTALLIWMHFFTRHGSAVAIPDIYGMTVRDAEEALDRMDLKYEIIDSVYSDEVPPGAVLEVTPKIGKKVKAGRVIFLTINATAPRQGVIPSVIDVSERQAMVKLRSLGFEQISLSYIPGAYDDLAQEVQLMSGETLLPGTRVALSTPLVLVVSVAVDSEYPEHGLFESEADSAAHALSPDTATAVPSIPDEDESWM